MMAPAFWPIPASIRAKAVGNSMRTTPSIMAIQLGVGLGPGFTFSMSTAPLTSAGMTLGSARWGEAPQPPQGIPHRASLEEGTVAELSFRVNLLKHWEALGGTFLESPKPPFGARSRDTGDLGDVGLLLLDALVLTMPAASES